MKNQIIKLMLSLVIPAVFMVSCSKDPGDGGSAGIRGKVFAKYYDDAFTAKIGEGYAPDQDVYLIYGDDATFSDHVQTSYNGTYEFTYLRKGTYKVYTYSKDSTLTIPSGKYAVIAEVEITSNKQTVEVIDLEIFD